MKEIKKKHQTFRKISGGNLAFLRAALGHAFSSYQFADKVYNGAIATGEYMERQRAAERARLAAERAERYSYYDHVDLSRWNGYTR